MPLPRRNFDRGRVLALGLVLWLGLCLGLGPALAQSAATLPNAETQFIDGNGAPYASGQVFFYVPSTTTPKATWVDPNNTTLNGNPVVLDASGRALIYGNGLYRQVLKDQFGNTIWDQLTWAPPSLLNNQLYGNVSGKTALPIGLSVSQVLSMLGLSSSANWTPTIITPSQYGAMCNSNGTAGNGNDDTTALQNWINAGQTGPSVLYVPPGVTYCRTTAPLVITTQVSMFGASCQMVNTSQKSSTGAGSWFFFDHLGQGIVVNPILPESTGTIIERVCTRRAQAVPAALWAPLAANYDFYVSANSDLTLNDVYLLNPTRGIYSNGRVTLQHVWGQPFIVGFRADTGAISSVLNNVQWAPFWFNDPTYLEPYMQANLTSFWFDGINGANLTNVSATFTNFCLYFAQQATGPATKFAADNVECEVVGGSGIEVNSSTVGGSWSINNIRVTGANLTSTGNLVDFNGSGSFGQISNGQFYTSLVNCISDVGANLLVVSNVRCSSWGGGSASSTGTAAVFAGSGAEVVVSGGLTIDSGPSTGPEYNTSSGKISGQAFYGLYATATIPSCTSGLRGLKLVVTDASSPTYGTNYTGGSTTYANVMCNSSNWIYN